MRPKRGLGRGLALNVSMGGARGLGHCLAARRDFKSSLVPSLAVRLAVRRAEGRLATGRAEGFGPVPCSKQRVSERAMRRAPQCAEPRSGRADGRLTTGRAEGPWTSA